MENQVKPLFGGQIVVQRFHMLPTPKPGESWRWIYKAWRRLDCGIFEPHECHTLTTFDGIWYGQVGNDPEHAKYNHLPVGAERSKALADAYAYRAMVATQYIHDGFTETRGHYAGEFGEIEIIREG